MESWIMRRNGPAGILMALCLIAVLTGCGKNGSNDSANAFATNDLAAPARTLSRILLLRPPTGKTGRRQRTCLSKIRTCVYSSCGSIRRKNGMRM